MVGARGINALLLAKYLRPRQDALGAGNVLVLGAGPLAGTPAPRSSRAHITFKSPETEILGDGSIGGPFAAAMRGAGFDHVVILGRAPQPSLLWIENGHVEIRDARPLWGLDAWATQARLVNDDGPLPALVAGPAGERLVRFASVRSGARRSARCGGGAVLGSKLLKGIVAVGSGPVPVADPEGLTQQARTLEARIGHSYVGRLLEGEGTTIFYDSANAAGLLRSRNGQASQGSEALGSAAWAGRPQRPEFSTLALLGPNLGLERPEDVERLAAVCNELGFDTSSAGGYLAWACELFQRGLLSESLAGKPVRWGDAAGMERLLRDCAGREGFGNVLAEGSRAVALGYYPNEAARYFPGVKGLPPSDAHDVRLVKAFALGLAVASRGADHLRNRPGLEWFQTMPLAAKAQLYGAGVTADPASYEGKAQTVIASEDAYAVADSAGTSKLLAQGFNSPGLVGLDDIALLLRAATGEPWSAQDLREAGARIVDLERWINLREGLTRADDTLPARCFDEPLPHGPFQGARIDRERFERMLDEYYARRGWQPDGTLPPATARDLEALLAS